MSAAVQDFVARQPRIDKRRRYLRPALYHVLSLLCKTEVTGLERIPASGPTILLINHISFLDPVVFTAVVAERYVISMAKIESLDNWFYRQIVHLWGNFVIDRDALDRDALMNAIELLKHDQLVLIAPEGTRNRQGMQAAKSGAAYIAHKANAVIVPAAICDVQDFASRWKRLRRAHARVHFGQPFRFTLPEGQRLSRSAREMMMQEAMYQLALTIPNEYADQRGVYSDLDRATSHYLDFLG